MVMQVDQMPHEIESVHTNLPPLIEAMTHPAFYPDPANTVELKQTHISYVFLAGDYAYKVKKPVRFAFLDCARLAERYRLCVEEVRLNRRLSPEVYLGVFPILQERGRFVLGDEARAFDTRACEYAVKMRRLPEDRMLDRLVGARAAGKDTIAMLARRLAAFHRDCSTARSWTYGSAAAIWHIVIGDLKEDEQFAGYTISEPRLRALEEHCRAFMTAHWELLNDRARDHRVRECHGDLRCDSVCVTDGLAIFDCLEFSERLRYCDVASEIAFCAMDLDRLGARGLADELVTAYAEASNDEAALLLVPFYKCFRATVRGKVESIRTLEQEVPAADRERAMETARACFTLALRYAQAATPALLVTCGLSGTGKSTVARLLQLRTGFEIVNSDRVRKRLAGIRETDHVRESYQGGIYSGDFTRITYQTLLAEADARLAEGCGVIVDATFRAAADRRRLLDTAARHGTPALFFECRAPADEVFRRLREREQSSGEVSDATREIYLRQAGEFEPITELSEGSHLTVDTTEDQTGIASRIEEALLRLFNST
jgi:aminoglycoside phosphotransferase family enzyme/adenylate kinase family enzyme